jgi:hypothetical protein
MAFCSALARLVRCGNSPPASVGARLQVLGLLLG